jgi:hypothetical protein
VRRVEPAAVHCHVGDYGRCPGCNATRATRIAASDAISG